MQSMDSPYSGMSMDNPLATQFMSQGQMGYMPQAQYLTNPSYGAFRTMPGVNMGQQSMQSPSLWQSYLQANRGSAFGLPNYSFNSYNPMVNQINQQVMAQRRISDAGGAFRNAGLSALTGMLPSTLGFAMGGPIGGLVGMGVSALLPDFGGNLTERTRQMRQVQNLSMSAVTTGPDMAGATGMGFTARASGGLNDSLRKMASTDISFNHEDYQSFLKSGVQHGLMNYSSTAMEFAGTVKKLKDNVKVLKGIFENKDIEDIFKDMKRMQTLGASMGSVKAIGAHESTFSRMAGMAQEDMVNAYGMQGAMQYSQAGLTGYQGSLQAMSTAASFETSKRMGIVSIGAASRMGDTSGFTQASTDVSTNMQNIFKNIYMPGVTNVGGRDPNGDFDKLLKGVLSFKEAGQRGAANRANEGTAEFNTRASNAPGALEKLLGDSPLKKALLELTMAIERGKDLIPGGKLHTQIAAGFNSYGASPEASKIMADQYTNTGYWNTMLKQQATTANQIKTNEIEEEKSAHTLQGRFKMWFKEFSEDWGSDIFGDIAAWRAAAADDEENKYNPNYSGGSHGFNTPLKENPKKRYEIGTATGAPSRKGKGRTNYNPYSGKSVVPFMPVPTGDIYNQLIAVEGFKKHSYVDTPGKNGKPPTYAIGIGRNLTLNPLTKEERDHFGYYDTEDRTFSGLVLDEKGIDYLFQHDLENSKKGLRGEFEDFDSFPDEQQNILITMYHQLGSGGFHGFEDLRKAVKDNDWNTVAAEMRNSTWWREQTPERAEGLAQRAEAVAGNKYVLDPDNKGKVKPITFNESNAGAPEIQEAQLQRFLKGIKLSESDPDPNRVLTTGKSTYPGVGMDQLRFAEEFNKNAAMSDADKATAMGNLGLTGIEVEATMQGLDVGGVNANNFIRLYAKKKGISEKEAERILRKDSGAGMHYMMAKGHAVGGSELEYAVKIRAEGAAKAHTSYIAQTTRGNYDTAYALTKQLTEHSNMWGLGDNGDAKTLQQATDEVDNPDEKGKALNIFGIQAIMGTRLNNKRGFNSTDKAAIEKLARQIGMPEAAINSMLKNGDTDELDKFAGKMGIEKGTLTAMKQAAYKKAKELTSESKIKEFTEGIGDASNALRSADEAAREAGIQIAKTPGNKEAAGANPTMEAIKVSGEITATALQKIFELMAEVIKSPGNKKVASPLSGGNN